MKILIHSIINATAVACRGVPLFLTSIYPFCAHAQLGTVFFGNNESPIPYVTNGLTGQRVAAGDPGAFTVGLYWGPPDSAENSLTLGPITSRWPSDGVFEAPTPNYIKLPVLAGSQVALQIRIWQSGFSTFEAAVADPSMPLVGKGNLQKILTGGQGDPPSLPASLVNPAGVGSIGLQPITLYPVPEPIAGVLFLVGAGVFAAARATRRHPR